MKIRVRTKRHFTISIEAIKGTTTGVSASDRIQTIKTATSETAEPSDLVFPRHVFPLIGKNDGVLERRGQTEGSIDLVKLAGLGDTAVLCKLMNVDGTMAKPGQIIEFADENNLTVVTIEDIVIAVPGYNNFKPVFGLLFSKKKGRFENYQTGLLLLWDL
jgi:3,4-dihydroxy 2-butanone 4-phosphate synthase